jgi:tRNA nucleotidyltransferase (CCA-adding enzyme)
MQNTLSSGLNQLLDFVTASANSHDIPLYVVGGFVRDLLLGVPHLDLDFVVESDGIAFAQSLQEQYGGEIEPHFPFGTATWTLNPDIASTAGANFAEWPSFVDIVTARRETYAHPGALPDVIPSVIRDDLHRRDFTINAMAIRLTPTLALLDPFGGQQDLQSGMVRVLHDKSFIDDATRIFRAVRFEQRFGFQIEPHTRDLIPEALPTLKKISGERLRHEIDLILQEAEPERALRRLGELHVLSTIDEKLEFDEWCATKFKLVRTQESTFSRGKTSALFVQSEVARQTIYWIILGWNLPDVSDFARSLMLSGDFITALVESKRLSKVLPELSAKLKPSEVVARLEGRKEILSAVYEALWYLAPDEIAQGNIADYVTQWRTVKPSLTGDDLKAMGLEEGPQFGRLLRALRWAKLDGEVSTPAEERAFIERLLAEGTER